ncbi:hypothetical protein KP509_22G056300 [Ceratopteris richardii]|uniref:Tify domain-containing protein n=1 Tax=Ceratopteris richardii TaxID=49495 RepID=A0A8T2S8A9_CERRI|nr:hypothetical protein KP509_22G056300 [Ceratopteris richardii]
MQDMASGTLDLIGGLARSSAGPAAPRQTPAPSQLTIFYDGAVNVYEDVPPDKAHAIMLLLGSIGDRQGRGADASTSTNSVAVGTVASNPATCVSRLPPVGTATVFKQPFSRPSTPPPSSPFQVPQLDRKPQQLVGKRTQAELPFARKASLARFLEKRKDRVQAKAVDPAEEENCEASNKKLKLGDRDMVPPE